MVSGIPEIRDPMERKKRLKAAAKELMGEWENYRQALPHYAKAAFGAGVRKTLPDFVKKIGPAITSGSIAATILGALPGLALGFLTYSIAGLWGKYQERASHPYRYLSRIHRAGATLLLTVPAATERVP